MSRIIGHEPFVIDNIKKSLFFSIDDLFIYTLFLALLVFKCFKLLSSVFTKLLISIHTVSI